MWITSSLPAVLSPATVALGNFDGVHLGHRQVILPILSTEPDQPPLAASADVADEPATAASCTIPIYPTVLTFHPHPQEFFSGQKRLLLTPLEQKATLLKAMGIQQLVLLPFDQDLAALSPPAFVEKILVQHLQAKRISVGENFRFGHRRSGTVEDLVAIATAYGIEVCVVPLENRQSERISSSRIRQALEDGDIALANRLLGYPYTLSGTVQQGQQLGRTLGFPTANLKISPRKFLPRQGVYAVQVEIRRGAAAPRHLVGVVNLGTRPSVGGQQILPEIHIFDWSGDLYGHTLNVGLTHFLRPEQKFESLDALKAQIQADCHQAQCLFAQVPAPHP